MSTPPPADTPPRQHRETKEHTVDLDLRTYEEHDAADDAAHSDAIALATGREARP